MTSAVRLHGQEKQRLGKDSQEQGRRKLPKGGAAALLDQSSDAGKGSDIEGVRTVIPREAREKKSPSFSVIRMGSRGTFVLRRLGSVAFKLFAAIDL